MPYSDRLDIANRVCQHLGVQQINSLTEDSVQNQEISFAYDKVRRAELRRNVWRFATRRTVMRPVSPTMMLLSAAAWQSGALYLPGSIVSDANGLLWISAAPENTGNVPGASGAWEQFFGPLTVDAFSASTSYWAGELVYVPLGNPGSYVVFMSLISGNTDVPNTATAWDATVQYGMDATVTRGGSQWRSLIAVNKGITPAEGPAAWNISVIYASAATATGSDGYIYSSTSNGNVGHDPVTDAGVHWTNTGIAKAWSALPALYPSSINWLPIYASLTPLTFLYPIGSGPSTQSTTSNVFRLPANFLREAPQDPKAGASSALGAPGTLNYEDWEYEGNFLVSQTDSPIVYRFVADVVTVPNFDDMFCEGLAARIAMETCERITNSTAKLAAATQAYAKTMGEARDVNGIETGSVQPPTDDYIACRA
jgi:hypothetical protein